MNRKRLFSAILAVFLFFSLMGAAPTRASAATTTVCGFEVKGAILATALKAAGVTAGEDPAAEMESVLGCPMEPEALIVVSGKNTYHLDFQHFTIYWDSTQGGKWWRIGEVPSLSRVSNERDALGSSGMKSRIVFRSAKLCGASTNDKRLMTAMMHGGTIVDLRESSAVSECKDPSLPTVSRFYRSMTSTTSLSSFITRASDRTALRYVLNAIAAEDGPIWIHCTRGRDRTGWVVMNLLMLGGTSNDLIREEYLRTTGTSGSTYDKAIKLLNDTYDGPEGFWTDGVGLTQATIEKLQQKLT